MIAVDTNVLVYAHRREVAEHRVAYRVVEELVEGAEPWAIPWPCVYEFFSVVTNPRIWKATVTAPKQAWAQLAQWFGSPTLQLLSEPHSFTSILAAFLERPRVRGPLVHDARVAALCVGHGITELLSRDRDFSLFPELAIRNPF